MRRELALQPRFDNLETGLADSYANDYAQQPPTNPDFSGDEALLA